MARQTLVDSIEALEDEDFGCPQGWKTDIYLDPEAERVYTFLGNNSMPMSAYHGIDKRIVTGGGSVIPSSVCRAMADIEEDLDYLMDLYEGSEWDGSNHVGQWKEESGDVLERALEKMPEVAYYWDAGDWFEPVKDRLKAAWESGKTAEQIIDYEGCGDDVDGMCDRDEAISWLEYLIEEWKTETEDESE